MNFQFSGVPKEIHYLTRPNLLHFVWCHTEKIMHYANFLSENNLAFLLYIANATPKLLVKLWTGLAAFDPLPHLIASSKNQSNFKDHLLKDALFNLLLYFQSKRIIGRKIQSFGFFLDRGEHLQPFIQCVAIPKIWMKPNPKLFSDTKLFWYRIWYFLYQIYLYWIRYFFRNQILFILF